MTNINDNSPDYSQYTVEELADVVSRIDQAQFPQRCAEAKAMLASKLQEQKDQGTDSKGEQGSQPQAKIKWSEQLLITRLLLGSFMVMAFAVVPTWFYEFLTAKSWTAKTTGLVWILVFIHVTMWFVCLNKDIKFAQRLGKSWRGTLTIVVIPFLFALMSWLFIDRSLPLGLHLISAQQNVRYAMDYHKRSGRKHCRQRIEINETVEFGKGDLCMTESQRNSLPEKGTITVLGARSRFGMVINGFYRP